ncbi:hypothetical protein DTO012A8_10071 [Penicillium roqueforti]|nr:hypothetical protein DTO012A8_10071 [Penicillium roqueforti]
MSSIHVPSINQILTTPPICVFAGCALATLVRNQSGHNPLRTWCTKLSNRAFLAVRSSAIEDASAELQRSFSSDPRGVGNRP